MKISAILLAAGEGRRLKKSAPKAFVKISGRELFLYSLELLERHPRIFEIILVVPRSKIPAAKKLADGFKKISRIVNGRKTRMESLAAGLKVCGGKFVLSQNAANPFATAEEISRCLKFIQKQKAAGVGRQASSTVRFSTSSKKKIGEIGGGNSQTLDRKKIWLMETPQIVEKQILKEGLKIARIQKIEATDELQLAELAGAKIKILPADPQNRKITQLIDLPIERRIGLGHDSHKFSKTRKPLILGGIQISKDGGLAANSDGDVILHALTNAISSALGGGSLSNFADEICRRGVRDSKKYLKIILKKMQREGFEIQNLAIAIEGSRPKLEKHFPRMKKNLAKLLEINSKKIGITATTGEELNSFGKGEGLQVFAIVLLKEAE